MKIAKWPRRAGWLSALSIAAAAGPLTLADDEPAKDAAPAAPAAAPAEPAPPREPEPPRPPRPPRPAYGFTATSKYILKMHLAPLPKVVDQQLGLKGEGVLVGRVEPAGPAGKAGIQEDDIVLAVGDQPVKGPADLMKAVDASDGKELSLKLLRAGKPVTVAVTPEPRLTGSLNITAPKLEDIEELRELEIKIREKLEAAGIDMRMQFIQPGKFLPQGADFLFERRIEFPDDLAVEIKKKGKEPAQIDVKKGDQSWSVAEGKLEELPHEVRMHVEGLLGRGPMRMKLMSDMRHHGGPPGPGGPHGLSVPDGSAGPHGPLGPHEFGPPPPGGPPGPPDRPGPRVRRPDGPPPPEAREGGPDGPRRGPDERGPRGFRPRPDGPGDHGERVRPDRGPRGRGGLEQRLDELSHEFERMRSRIESLREDLREEAEDE